MEVHPELQQALDNIKQVPLPTLKRLARVHLQLSFEKTDKLSKVLEAIQHATAAPPPVPAPGLVPPLGRDSDTITAFIDINLSSSKGVSRIPFLLPVASDGTCLWNDATALIIDVLNKNAYLKLHSHTLVLITPHGVIPIQNNGDRFVCPVDQGELLAVVVPNYVFIVEHVVPVRQMSTASSIPVDPSRNTSVHTTRSEAHSAEDTVQRFCRMIVEFKATNPDASDRWAYLTRCSKLKMEPLKTFELFRDFVHPLLDQSGVLTGDEAMSHLADACKRHGAPSKGMLEIGMSLKKVKLCEVDAFLEENSGLDALRTPVGKGPKYALDQFFEIIKGEGVLEGDD